MNQFLSDVLYSAGLFFKAPFQDLSLLWQLIPVLLIWILMEVYFGLYKHEKLGWNTAVGNGVTLFWIGVTSMQHVFSNQQLFSTQRFIILLVGILYSLFIIFISFKHKLRKSYAFFLASPTPIYFLSFLVIIYAHGVLHFDLPMFVAIIAIFLVLFGVDRLLHALLPEAKAEITEESGATDKYDSGNFSDFSTPQGLDADTSKLPPSNSTDPFADSGVSGDKQQPNL